MIANFHRRHPISGTLKKETWRLNGADFQFHSANPERKSRSFCKSSSLRFDSCGVTVKSLPLRCSISVHSGHHASEAHCECDPPRHASTEPKTRKTGKFHFQSPNIPFCTLLLGSYFKWPFPCILPPSFLEFLLGGRESNVRNRPFQWVPRRG